MAKNNDHDKGGNKWQGKRFRCLVRQSNDDEGNDSTRAQLAFLRQECEALGMIHDEDIVLEGVSGSVPGRRADLDKLLDDKRKGGTFDVLAVQRCDRLTRGGADHGFWLRYECTKLGIELIFPGDGIPDGPWAGVIRAAKFEAAREQARSISQRSTQGAGLALSEGRTTSCSRTPFGCWRLYMSADGTPMYYIRNVGDGRQEKLHPESLEVIDTFGQPGGGSKGHYRKQKSEQVTITPGDAGPAQTVRQIMIWHWRDGLGGKRIADRLNSAGVASPEGRQWSQRQVEVIYENTAYGGLGIANLSSNAIFHERTNNSRPKEVDMPESVLAAGTPPKRLRPPEDWVWVELPLMCDFLPTDVRDRLLAEVPKLLKERHARASDPSVPKRSKSKHKETSPYLLTGRLVAKQDGDHLVGVLTGRKGKEQRRYRHKRSRRGYEKGSLFNRTFAAEPLERAVLDLLLAVLLDADLIRSRVLAHAHQQAAVQDDQPALDALQQERDSIRKRVQSIVRTFDEATLADAQPELDRLAQRRREIETQLAAAETQASRQQQDPEAIAAQAMAALADLADSANAASPAVLRRLIHAFVEQVVVDLETRSVEIALRLPESVFESGKAMCLVPSSGSPTGHETHQDGLAIRLAFADCQYAHTPGSTTVPPCYRCRRRAA